ncbi:MAG: hypothetical protein KF764_18890 [Labilithrix sp.]|nr:hypothetical protein [Labilithrix sp.]
MRPTTKSLHALTFLVAVAAGASVMLGCVADGDGGPTLNPQPLPPAPPEDDKKDEESRNPSGFGGGTGSDDGAGASSSGSPGSSGSPDAGAGDARRTSSSGLLPAILLPTDGGR